MSPFDLNGSIYCETPIFAGKHPLNWFHLVPQSSILQNFNLTLENHPFTLVPLRDFPRFPIKTDNFLAFTELLQGPRVGSCRLFLEQIH